MGVFDEVKDSITGSSSGGQDSGFESGDFDDSFSQDGNSPQGGLNDTPDQQPAGNRQGQQRQQPGNAGAAQNNSIGDGLNSSQPGNRNQQPQGRGNSAQNSPNSPGNQRSSRQQPRNSSPQNSPNAQAGRPEQGGTEPQLSSQTERKLENAGFDDTRGNRQTGNSTDSVADRQDDFEKLKSQNEQIIELLKRINQSLSSGGRGSGRHQR